MEDSPLICVGVDIAEFRGCAAYAIDVRGAYVDSLWMTGSYENVVASLGDFVTALADGKRERVAVGIDSPRWPLTSQRRWYWRRGKWVNAAPGDVGWGRHCEVVIAAHGLATPQWTPPDKQCPGWMQLGFLCFRALAEWPHVYETFPSASYAMLSKTTERIDLVLSQFAPGPKDMLDALVGAVTVREYVLGRGASVGGGDGLGEIILPRPLTAGRAAAASTWPVG